MRTNSYPGAQTTAARARPGKRKRLGAFASCALLCLILGACAGALREPAPQGALADAVPVGFGSNVRWPLRATRAELHERSLMFQARILKAAGNGPLNILALSGGGAGGAFGAGVLVGWSRTGTRPQFQVVTGVSAGALIAPMAFLGSDWDQQLTEAFSGHDTADLLQSHVLGALFGVSVFEGEPLRRLVDRFVTDALLRAIAAESRKGRMLLVGTTDLDREELVIWDMGAIAAQGGEAARTLFRDVLVASASVPSLFPPVLIRVEASGKTYEEMHVDGGAVASLVAAPDIAAVAPIEIAHLGNARLYVVVNGKLSAPESTTSMLTMSILKRSVETALTSVTRADVELAYGFARLRGIELHATAVPNSYPLGGALDFEPSAVNALYEYGVRCAMAGQVWGDALHFLEEDPDTPPAASAASCPATGDAAR